jgi:hypothetical protein
MGARSGKIIYITESDELNVRTLMVAIFSISCSFLHFVVRVALFQPTGDYLCRDGCCNELGGCEATFHDTACLTPFLVWEIN